jgi:hypothetical protein
LGDLAKIAELTKPVSDNLGGPKNSRSFVFSAMSQDDGEEKTELGSKKIKPQVRFLLNYKIR